MPGYQVYISIPVIRLQKEADGDGHMFRYRSQVKAEMLTDFFQGNGVIGWLRSTDVSAVEPQSIECPTLKKFTSGP